MVSNVSTYNIPCVRIYAVASERAPVRKPDHVTSLPTHSAATLALCTSSSAFIVPRSVPLPHIQGPPLAAPLPLPEDTWIAHSSPMCHLESCHSTSHTTCMAPCKLSPCSGLYFRWIRILLYICSFNPLSYVPLLSFRPRPPASCASFPSFTFASCHRTSLHRLRLYAPRLAPEYNPNNGFFCQRHRVGLSPARPTSHSFLCFSFSPSTHSARSVLVTTALDSRMNTSPGFAKGGQSWPDFLVCVRSTLARPDRRKAEPTSHRSPSCFGVRIYPFSPHLLTFSDRIASCYRLKRTQ